MAMHVYELEGDYYAARSLEEAVEEFREMVLRNPEEAHEVPDDAMDRLEVALTDENDELTGERVTFRQYLQSQTCGEDSAAFFLCGED